MKPETIVFMKYKFERLTRPGARASDPPTQYYCKALRVTVLRQGPETAARPWSAWRTGVRGFVEWYAAPSGATRNFSTAQKCIKSLVESDWLVGV